MPNTYSKIYLQFIFAVQNRQSVIKKEWRDQLYKYIAGIIQNNGHKLLAINGIPDHIHIFLGYNEQQPVPKLMQDVKGWSSKWINSNNFINGKFIWQEGYGVFSYSHSQIDRVVKYILHQEQHHKQRTFQKEYIYFLNKFNVQYDKRYILKDV